MSSWISASSSPNRNSARALASSVFPTPVGPAKMNEPPGRLGSLSPARVRRIAWDSALMAASWPMIRLCSSSSMRSRREDSSSVSLTIGMPVETARTSAISSSSTSATTSMSPAFHCFSRSALAASSFFSPSRSEAAFSKSCASIAHSFSRRTAAIFSSNSRRSGGAVIRRMRSRAPASSIRSIALSGRNRSLTYRSASVRRGDQRGVGDRDPVVRLVPVAQALEDLDGVRQRRLLHLDRLEAPLQGRVLLDVLAVLVERRRADRSAARRGPASA